MAFRAGEPTGTGDGGPVASETRPERVHFRPAGDRGCARVPALTPNRWRGGFCGLTGRNIEGTVRDLTCSEVADSAPGFALDILEPQTRARVAAHLIRCQDCRRTVTDMEESAADLLDLDGRMEWTYPEEAYEVAEVRPGRRRLRTVCTMAAAAALFVGTTFGPELASHRSAQPLASGVLMAGEQPVGTVQFYAGGPAVIEVQADHLPASGTLGVVVGYIDGSATRIGDIKVRSGRASWAGTEPARPAGVSSVALVDSELHPVATASFR